MERPSVFNYSDFRIFLGELFEFRNSRDKRFTKSRICREMGLENTRSYFQDILNGKYLTPIKANLIAKSFELSAEETKFFKVMVNFNQAFDDPQERDFCFEQMLSLKKASGEEIPEESFRYYRKWYNPVIKLILTMIDIADDHRPIQKVLKQDLTLKEIGESIDLLNELNLIEKNGLGFWKCTSKVLRTPEYCQSDIIKNYQVETLMQAQKSILQNDDTAQRTITKMVSFSGEGYEKVMAALERFSNEINVIVSEDAEQEDRIYQMILSLFPYSKGTVQ